jgi:hypothetical protein
MLVSHYQNADQNWDIKITNRSFENVLQFKYLGKTVTNPNFIQEEIKRRLNSNNACYHSVQNLLCSHLQSRRLRIRIYKTIILPVVCMGVKLENISHFKYLGKRRLNFGNASYHSAQNLLCFHLLSKRLKIRIYMTIILRVVLYGYESWSLTLREEHRLGVFENRMLRRIFGPNRDEVMGGWRKLHNEELHDLYSSPSIMRIIKSRKMRWARYVV